MSRGVKQTKTGDTQMATKGKKMNKSTKVAKVVKVVENKVVDTLMSDVVVGEGMKVIFVDVTVKGMSMNKQDKERSKQLNDDGHAEEGTAKVLLKKFPESFCKPITNAGQKVYQVYKTYGMQMYGHYAVPIKIYPKFKDELAKAITQFDLCVSAMRDAVQTGALEEIAKVQQGDFFDSSCVLTVQDVDKNFGVLAKTWINLKCADIDKAMAILGEETVSYIKGEHQKAIAEAKKESETVGAKRVAEGISELVTDIIQKCKQESQKGIQWKTVVTHIQKAIETLPTFNVTDNPAVASALKVMEDKLGSIKEYELKNDAEKRKALLVGATELGESFAKMFE